MESIVPFRALFHGLWAVLNLETLFLGGWERAGAARKTSISVLLHEVRPWSHAYEISYSLSLYSPLGS